MIGLPELGRRHRRLPHLAFLDLAVAHDAVHAAGRAGQLEAERHAERDREALAERAGGRLDAGQRHAVRVALERAAELAQRDELALREVAGARHHRVEGGHRVALGEHDAVAIGPVRTPGVVPQPAEDDRHEQVDDRKRPARVAGAGVRQHPDDLHAAGPGDRLQLGVRHQGFSSAMASICIPDTAISGV
jgi:hypothetical protein